MPGLSSEPASAALGLYAKVLAARTLKTAAHNLVAALANDAGFDRASIALHNDGRTRLLASSNLDAAIQQAELPQLLLGAMMEAIEQQSSLAWPSPAGLPDAAADLIRLEQQALQRQVGGAVASVPLGFDGEMFCAVCVERHQGPAIGPDELARLEQLLMLAAPALRWIYYAEQPWLQRTRRVMLQGLTVLRQPRKRGARRMLAGAALLFLLVAVVPLEHTVSGRARVEGAQQRVLSAPADGFIKAAHVRPGDRVKAGDALVDLIDEDLQSEHARWSSQLAQHENAYAAAMAKSDRVAASTSFARVAQAQAQLALVEGQRTRARITSPIDALVVQGDLSQSIGAPVRQGDALLTLATTDRYRVIVEIDETDIARVRKGQAGRLVVSSLPWEHQDLLVERVTPLAKAVEGRNVFEVEAQLAGAAGQLRPGLLGRADLVIGRLPPLWAWGRRALDRIRLAWWSWVG
ncbi:MAG: HlyD family efflux transporter periplasmic adaptor subunit [Rhodoferax sp.]|nr:HlyD family efflux transporter periplasmic adaptor subunit [Rhodoferax sp.]